MDAVHGARNKIARILDILEALLNNPPPITLWPEWMRRVTATLAQYENISRDLRGRLLGQLLVVPAVEGLATLGGNSEVVPNVLLRTRLPPEVEKSIQSLDRDENVEPRAASSGASVNNLLAQLLQEAADAIKSTARMSLDTPLVENEALIRVVKGQHTILDY